MSKISTQSINISKRDLCRWFFEKFNRNHQKLFVYRISLNNVLPWIMSPLNNVPFFEKGQYIKKEHYSSFCTSGHYLRKYSISREIGANLVRCLVKWAKKFSTFYRKKHKVQKLPISCPKLCISCQSTRWMVNYIIFGA